MSSDQDLAQAIERVAKKLGAWGVICLDDLSEGVVLPHDLGWDVAFYPEEIHHDREPELCAFACWVEAKMAGRVGFYRNDRFGDPLLIVTNGFNSEMVNCDYTDPLGRSKAIIQLADRVLAMEEDKS